MPMTAQEMDLDLFDLRAYLDCCPVFRVERCTHPSVDATSLWIFDSQTGQQIAAASRNGNRWTVNKMLNGQPVTNRTCEKLLDVASYLVKTP